MSISPLPNGNPSPLSPKQVFDIECKIAALLRDGRDDVEEALGYLFGTHPIERDLKKSRDLMYDALGKVGYAAYLLGTYMEDIEKADDIIIAPDDDPTPPQEPTPEAFNGLKGGA